MLAFLGLIINMGVIHLPYVKDYWSQQFECRVPSFGEVFTRKHFLKIFWMLHLETVSTSDHSLRTRAQKVSNFLKYIDARFREHFIPGQNLLVDESVVGFKGKISFITYNPKNQIMGNLCLCSGRLCHQLCLHLHPLPRQNHHRQPHQARPSFYIPNRSSTCP